MGRPSENRFSQCSEADLLPQEVTALREWGGSRELWLQSAPRGKIAAVESEKKVAEPGVLSLRERIEDRMEEKFAEVVDRVGC